jgi:hypothetical protein
MPPGPRPAASRPSLPIGFVWPRRCAIQAADRTRPPTMGRSDSRRVRRRFLSLRLPSGLGLAISAAGTLRASSVSCDSFRARQSSIPIFLPPCFCHQIPLPAIPLTSFKPPSVRQNPVHPVHPLNPVKTSSPSTSSISGNRFFPPRSGPSKKNLQKDLACPFIMWDIENRRAALPASLRPQPSQAKAGSLTYRQAPVARQTRERPETIQPDPP